MAQIKITCEHCGQHIQCDEGYCGHKINCPKCQTPLIVPQSTGSKSKGKPQKKKLSRKETIAMIAEENRDYFEQLEAKNEVGMFVCPRCKNQCAVAHELIGSKVKCPQCSKTFSAVWHEKGNNKIRNSAAHNLLAIAVIIIFLGVGIWILGCIFNFTAPLVKSSVSGVSHFFGSVKTSIGATANSVQSSLANSSIKGCVYVTIRNGNAVKMSGIQVFALEETALRKRIQEINGTIQSDFQSSLEKAGVKESDTWLLEEKASWEAGLVNDKILNPGTAGFYSTTTDADGNYSFQGIKTGAYCLIARATREVGNEIEYHLWYCKIPAPTGVDKLGVIWKPDLANYYDLLNSNSFIQDVDRKVSSQDFANKAKQGILDGYWASIMINNYGLNLPVIYR